MLYFTLTKRIVNGQPVYYKRADDFSGSLWGRRISKAQYLKECAKFNAEPWPWLAEFINYDRLYLAPQVAERLVYTKEDRPWPKKSGPLLDL